MSVTGGNTRSKSSVVPIYPNRPVIFSESEKEHMFYTNQSRQLFVLCRKVNWCRIVLAICVHKGCDHGDMKFN